MKITEINSDELQIDDKNLRALIGGLLFASVGTALGIYGYVEATPGVPSWIGAAIGSIFVFGGLVMLFNAESRHVILRRLDMSEVVMKKLITKKIKATTFTTDQIASINYETHMEYERTTDSDGRTRDREERVSTVWVRLNDGIELTLASKRGSSGVAINGVSLNGRGRTPLYDEAARIASFFSVPLNTNGQNSNPDEGLAQVISTVKQEAATLTTQPSIAPLSQPVEPLPLRSPTTPVAVAMSAPDGSYAVVAPVTPDPVAVPVSPLVMPLPSQPAEASQSQQLPPRS